MARLTEQEKQDIIRYLEADKPCRTCQSAMPRRFPKSARKASISFLDLSLKGFSGRKLAKSLAQFT